MNHKVFNLFSGNEDKQRTIRFATKIEERIFLNFEI